MQLPLTLLASFRQVSKEADPPFPGPPCASSDTARNVQWPSRVAPEGESVGTNPQPVDQEKLETQRVPKMLKHLINTMCSLVSAVQTRAMKVILQVLGVAEPFLAVIL